MMYICNIIYDSSAACRRVNTIFTKFCHNTVFMCSVLACSNEYKLHMTLVIKLKYIHGIYFQNATHKTLVHFINKKTCHLSTCKIIAINLKSKSLIARNLKKQKWKNAKT